MDGHEVDSTVTNPSPHKSQNPKPKNLNLKPQAQNPKPYNLSAKSYALNPTVHELTLGLPTGACWDLLRRVRGRHLQSAGDLAGYYRVFKFRAYRGFRGTILGGM